MSVLARLNLTRWDRIAFSVVLVAILVFAFIQPTTRASLLGRTTKTTATAMQVEIQANVCGHVPDQSGAAITWRWAHGQKVIVDCDKGHPNVGDTRTVWESPDHKDFTFNSPTADRFLWFAVLPAGGFVLLILMPRALLPVRMWSRRRRLSRANRRFGSGS